MITLDWLARRIEARDNYIISLRAEIESCQRQLDAALDDRAQIAAERAKIKDALGL